jgi:hypothetical protein
MAEALSTEDNPIVNAVFQKISDLQTLMLKNDPQLPGHLKAIHGTLSQYEEIVHLLSEDQIRQMIQAQKQATGTMLIQKVATSSKQSLTKQARGITADDL